MRVDVDQTWGNEAAPHIYAIQIRTNIAYLGNRSDLLTFDYQRFSRDNLAGQDDPAIHKCKSVPIFLNIHLHQSLIATGPIGE
jgi:hypothetical protein